MVILKRAGMASAGLMTATLSIMMLPAPVGAGALNIEPTVLTAAQITRIVTGVTLAGKTADVPIQVFFDPDQTFTLVVKKEGSPVRRFSGNWYAEPEADLLCLSVAAGELGRQCWTVRRGDTLEFNSARGALGPLEMPLTAVNFTAADAGQKDLPVEQDLPPGKTSSAGTGDAPAEKLRSRLAALVERTARQINADLPCSEVTLVADDSFNIAVQGSVRGQDDVAKVEDIIRSSGAAAFVSNLAGLTVNGGVGGRCAMALNGDWSVKIDPNGNPKRELKRDVLKLTEQSRLPDATDCKEIGAAIATAPLFAAAKAEGGDISFWVRGRSGLQPCLGSGDRWAVGRGSADDLDGFLVLRKN
jgi:hypothetical protein